MFDIDHFKQVNDREGHVHGDRVLQELADLFEECVRDTDIIARYGGEEFVIVMPQTDLAGASAFSERLRFQVANRLTITVSGGVTAAVEGDTPESLFARADTALYSAKDAGRNRVFCRLGDHTQPVAPEKAEQQRAPWAAIPGRLRRATTPSRLRPRRPNNRGLPGPPIPGRLRVCLQISPLSLCGEGPGVRA